MPILSPAAATELDLGLEVLLTVAADHGRPPLGYQEIADLCGCDRKLIYSIERRALLKLRAALTERRALDALHH